VFLGGPPLGDGPRYLHHRHSEGVPNIMSSIVYDYLLPLVGPEQAAYWARLLVVSPAD
jgi:hypothetical protein